MPPTRTFRIFVSSTFSDLKAERNALQERVLPRLRELCAAHGCRFQAIDLRWGVSEEASLDQQTMRICLGEIARCQQVTPRPNFIVLLGDRYGWCPPPPQIPASEFEEISTRVSKEDRELLERWYHRDDNAVPPEYVLQPRERGGPYEEYEDWQPVEARLHAILAEVAQEMDLGEDERLKYEASATHQEIAAGALRVEYASEHVSCFFRQIKGLPEDESARDFLDLDADDNPDTEARERLKRLKKKLHRFLRHNVHEYTAKWTGGGITTDHIDQLCEDVYQSLSRIILQQVGKLEAVEPLDAEISAHAAFGEDRARHFTGRTAMLEAIGEYIAGEDRHPLAIWGESGSGKSALLAKAVQETQGMNGDAAIVYRFIGATPESSGGRALLEGLCRQISRCYGVDESDIPLEYRYLAREFPERLSHAAAEQPLVIFIDALDQLSDVDNVRALTWLPAELPESVRLVVSTVPGECKTALEAKLPQECLVKLQPMTQDEAEELLDLWLENAHRALQLEQRREVLTNPKPLYLKLAFEEARRWHSYDTLPGLSDDIEGIIGDLFARLSQETNHGEVLISHSLGYLAAAKNGLTEGEILDVLSRDEKVMADFHRRSPKSPEVGRLPVVVWSRLHADLEAYLAERAAEGNVLITFHHPQLAAVATKQWLAQGKARDYHRRLANYFRSKADPGGDDTWSGDDLRGLSEAPYHQYHGNLVDQLVQTLTNRQFIDRTYAVFSQRTMLDNLELGLAAARESSEVTYGIRLLTAWGYTVGKGRIEDRIEGLLEQGRVKEAVRIAQHVKPATRACRLLTTMAQQTLASGQRQYAEKILRALVTSRLPVAASDLREYFRMIECFVDQGTWEALKCLLTDKPGLSVTYLLLYLIGTRHFSEALLTEIIRTIDALDHPYWQGVYLLFLSCRAARAGLDGARRAVDQLVEVLHKIPDEKDQLWLQVFASRCYRWLAPVGLTPAKLGVRADVGEQREANCVPAPCPIMHPGETRHGQFGFLPRGGVTSAERNGRSMVQVLRKALGTLADGCGCEVLAGSDDNLAWLRQGFSAATEYGGCATPLSLFWYSLIPERDRPAPDTMSVETQYNLAAMEEVERTELLFSLVRLGQDDTVYQSLMRWETEASGTSGLADVFRAARSLTHWSQTADFLTSASRRLRKYSASLGPEPATVVELAHGLLWYGCVEDALYWIYYLLNWIAPKMSFGMTEGLAPSTATRDAYVMLSQVIPPPPAVDHLDALRETALENALQLDRAHPLLDDAMRHEFRTQSAPLPYLGDRIMAFWAEGIGWRGPDAVESLRHFTRVLTLGVVNDDRERLRSWFFWLLVLSADPTAGHIEEWAAGVNGAYAPRQPHEQMILQMLGIEDARDWGRLDVLQATVSLLDERVGVASPKIAAELSDAVLRGLSGPVQQAEGMAYVAEACGRMRQELEAATFTATAGALTAGFERLAELRTSVARVIREGEQLSLNEWPDPASFAEVYAGLVETYGERGNSVALLGLTASLRNVADWWSDLLVALCDTRAAQEDAAAVGKALLEALEQYHE
jgi:hypothetical protein